MVREVLSSGHPENYRFLMFFDQRRKSFKEFRSDEWCCVAVKYNRINRGVVHYRVKRTIEYFLVTVAFNRYPKIKRMIGFVPGRKKLRDGFECFIGKFGQWKTAIVHKIGCNSSGASGKSEDGCAASGMTDHLFRKSSCHVGELGRIESFNYAGLSECAAGDLVVSRKACRVALCRPGAFGASASHKNDYRFFCFFREAGKSSSLQERFEIAGDNFGFVVIYHVFKDVALVNVAFVSDRTYLANAHDSFLQGGQHKSRRKHSALDNETHVSGFEHIGPDGRIEKRKNVCPVSIDEAHAVWAP